VQLFTVLVGEAVATEHPAHEFFAERYDHLREGTTRALRQAQHTGALRSDVDMEAVAALVIAVMDGLQVQWLLHRQLDMTETFRRFVEILLHYLTDGAAEPAEPSEPI
jgi:hypothetical protein